MCAGSSLISDIPELTNNSQPKQSPEVARRKMFCRIMLKYKIAIVFVGISDVRSYKNFRIIFPFFTPKDPFFIQEILDPVHWN